MNADYFALAIIAVLGIGGGLVLLHYAKESKSRRDAAHRHSTPTPSH